MVEPYIETILLGRWFLVHNLVVFCNTMLLSLAEQQCSDYIYHLAYNLQL